MDFETNTVHSTHSSNLALDDTPIDWEVHLEIFNFY